MWRANIRNRAFDRMGERFGTLIDPHHFGGKSAFDVKRPKREVPPANLIKKEHLFELQLAIPGYKREELEVELRDDVLIVRGERTKSPTVMEKEGNFIVEEFDFDSFERSFRLSPDIAHEKIEATYEQGMLRITFEDVPDEEERAFQKVKVM